MNAINPHNNQPLFSLEHLQGLNPEGQAEHIAQHIETMIGHFEGVAMALVPDHAQHQQIQDHIETLAQHHAGILHALDNFTEENPAPFNHAIATAHGLFIS